ncbi:tyrosine-type recombinase/integrase [Streptococcus ferus]|uniref:tyrosine-type recombinase/integrase n=1 Tax=Streptococcus ferus TaxID=1345 RepID=UPI0035A0F1ED
MFYKLLPNGKYRYYEKYFDEREDKWKQVSVTLKSRTRQVQAEAKRLLADKIQSNLSLVDNVSIISVAESVEEFLIIRRAELKLSTYHSQKIIIDNFVKEFGRLSLKKVSGKDVQRYLMTKVCSDSYRILQKTVLSVYFAYCVNVGYLKESPMNYVVLPRPKKELTKIIEKRDKFLNQEDMKNYLSYLKKNGSNPLFNLLAEFLYLTGLRSGEAFALDWEDVFVEKGYLEVKKNLYIKGVVSEYVITSPKTLAGFREVAFNQRVVAILDEVKQLTGSSEGFVFCNFEGLPIFINTFNNYLKKMFRESGVEKGKNFRLTSHVLRHSHISLLVELGVPIKVIMDRVGHSDEKTTIQIYTHVTENMRMDLSSKLELIDLK